jgi:DNA-binding PucR family transcriptional regulator
MGSSLFAAALRASGPAAQVAHAARLRERGLLAVSEDDHVRGIVSSEKADRLGDEGWLTVRGSASSPNSLADALDDAALAALGGAAAGRHGDTDVGEFAVEAMVLRSPELSRQLANDVLQPLEANDRRRRGGALVETLETYLSTGMDRAEAAARLHVHVNTLDLRLRRIRELSELRLDDATDLARIVLALRHRSIKPEP